MVLLCFGQPVLYICIVAAEEKHVTNNLKILLVVVTTILINLKTGIFIIMQMGIQ